MSVNIPSDARLPIDAVIPWVDGHDAELSERRNQWLAKEGLSPSHPGALPTFFASNDEIRYCVLSILKFAPFIRHIYIITDGQDPDLYKEIEDHFPERLDCLKIIDHREIFRGYESFLPTFNATSLNTMAYRIDGLSDNFVFFSDDVFLVRDHEPGDWFTGGRPLLRGKWLLPPWRRMVADKIKKFSRRTLQGRRDWQPRLSSYLRQWNGARMIGMRYRYLYHCHTPHPLSRRRLESFFNENGDLLEKNISYRFRSEEQFIASSLAYNLEILEGNVRVEGINQEYFHPCYSVGRLKRKIRNVKNNPRIKSICAQSLDIINKEVKEEIYKMMDNFLDIHRQSNPPVK